MERITLQLTSDVGAYTMEVLDGDYFRQCLATKRPYEEGVLRITTALTRPGDHIVDVGAHMGNHSIYWGLAGRRVTAFEPNPPVNELLRANVARNDLGAAVDVRSMAVGRSRASGTLSQVDPSNLGSTVLQPGEGEISITTLDEADLGPLALLKIDVEGHEADVLLGARQTIARWRPYIVAEELAGHQEVDDLIRELGYRRLPVDLASTPTRVYASSTRAAARVLTTRPYLQLAAGALAARLGRSRH